MSSPCGRVVEFLADYLERRLPPDVQADLERHLDACQACVAHVRTYRSTVTLLRSLCDDELPSELRRSLQAFLDHGSQN